MTGKKQPNGFGKSRNSTEDSLIGCVRRLCLEHVLPVSHTLCVLFAPSPRRRTARLAFWTTPRRISCSHANLVENIPLFAAVVLTNRAFGGPDISKLAQYYFYARCGQAAAHVSSVSSLAVNVRAGFFFASWMLLLKMAADTLTAM